MGVNIRAVHSVMNVREMCHALTGDHALQSKMISQKKMSGFDGCSVSAVQDAGYGRRRGHECKCTSDFGRLLRSATACFCGVFQ